VSHTFRSLFVVLLLLFGTAEISGCGRQKTTYSSPEGIERPARPLGEEKDVSDRAGEVIVAVLVVGGALALIAVPILLLVVL